MMTRRDAITSGIVAGGALALAGEGAAAAPPSGPSVDLSFLRTSPLLHEERARRFMAEEKLDALVMTRPANVFYLTNHWPQLDRMGFTDSAIAILPRDPARPAALIMGAFSYYYVHSDEAAFDHRLVFPYTVPADGGAADGPADPEPPAVPPRAFRVVDEARLTERERRRRASLAGARPNSATEAWALAKALRELRLDAGRLGVDEPHLEALVRARGLTATCVPAEDTVRRIRLVKSPTELRLMRIAAQNNVEAAMAAARQARSLGSTRALRDAFVTEAARRGNVAVFMVIDGSSSEVMDAPLRDGMALLFDCVSTCRYYHGDFSRTIFVGEPVPYMKRVTEAISTAWHDVREQLRPGLRFADIPRLGNESLRRQGMDLSVSFTPHSVGLFHTDHPRPSMTQNRSVEGLVVEEGMILSVDCPVLDTGIGGTAHIEDLMLIRANGAEPLHEVPPGVVVV